MKENNSLGFNFVDAEKAAEGLAKGKYYMVITIPEDFSKNATILMEDETKKMELRYETNPGQNYIASKMSETAVKEIQSNIREKITTQYIEIVFEQLETIGDGFVEAADGALQITDGTDKLLDGNKEMSNGLDTLSKGTLVLKTGSSTLAESLGDAADEVNGTKTDEDTVDMFAAPVTSVGSEYSYIENNGSAMTAYMMGVRLWAACFSANRHSSVGSFYSRGQ